jgi:hypothetical protein
MVGSVLSTGAAPSVPSFDARSDLCRLTLSSAKAARKVDVGRLSSVSLGTPANREYSRPSAVLANGMLMQTSEVSVNGVWNVYKKKNCIYRYASFFFVDQIQFNI